MTKVRLEWHIEGFEELRTSPAVLDALEAKANAIAESAANKMGGTVGTDFKVVKGAGKRRARVRVYASSNAADRAERKDGVLTRSLRG